MTILKAAITYFALVFAAAFVLGMFRVTVIAPAVGDLAAVLFELPVILAISWPVASWAVRRFRVAPILTERLAMGLVAFALLQAVEFALALALGETVEAYTRRLLSLAGTVGLLGQIAFAALPVFVSAASEPR